MVSIANSVFLRLATVLLALGVGFNVLMASAFLAPAGRERARLAALPDPAQAAAIVQVIETSPPDQRLVLIEALNSAALSVRLVEAPPTGERRPSTVVRAVGGMLTEYDTVFADRDLHVDLRPRQLGERIVTGDTSSRWTPARLYVRMIDSGWVMLEPTRGAVLDNLIIRGLTLGAFGGIIVLVGLWLAVRQTTRPIAQLSANVDAFADNLNAPPLNESGSSEVRALAHTFNRMKARIRDLVDERTRVLAAIAHDLRTYLTRLHLRAEFITDADQRARAERDLTEMAALVDDTLLFARAQHDNAASAATDAAEIVESFAAERREIGEAVALVTPLARGATVLSPLMLKRILSNLVDNALRYGGNARIALQRSDDRLLLSVEDDGPGIPDADLERVTAPFERLEPSRARDHGGAGLGLSIVRALLDAHGGSVELNNREPHGLLVRVVLPEFTQET